MVIQKVRGVLVTVELTVDDAAILAAACRAAEDADGFTGARACALEAMGAALQALALVGQALFCMRPDEITAWRGDLEALGVAMPE